PLLFSHTRPPTTSPPFPYTTLFRSVRGRAPTDSTGPAVKPTTTARKRSSHDRSTAVTSASLHSPLVSFHPRTAAASAGRVHGTRSEEHTSELQSLTNLVCRLLLEKK